MKMNNLKLNKKALAALMLTSSLTLTGCVEAECDIDEMHAHLYTTTTEDIIISKYIANEEYIVNGMKRNDDFIHIDDIDASISNAIQVYEKDNLKTSGNIIKIDDNKEYINYLYNNYQNYYDYKCEMNVLHTKGTYKKNPMNQFIPTIDKYEFFSKDSNNIYSTGYKRLNYYTFYGYNLVMNEKDEYELIESEDYFTLDDVLNNCEYISTNCHDLKRTEDLELIELIENKNSKVKIRK